eukprot:488645-Rhodomonas_salina.1
MTWREASIWEGRGSASCRSSSWTISPCSPHPRVCNPPPPPPPSSFAASFVSLLFAWVLRVVC